MGTKISITRELLIERERTLTLRLAAAPVSKFCAECGTEASFVTVGQAAMLRQTTDRCIFLFVEAVRLHAVESAEGRMLVCLASLQAFATDDDFDQLSSKK